MLRIAGSDVAGTLKTVYALKEIKGISMSLSNAILRKANINPDLRVGFLTESDVAKIEEIIEDPTKSIAHDVQARRFAFLANTIIG